MTQYRLVAVHLDGRKEETDLYVGDYNRPYRGDNWKYHVVYKTRVVKDKLFCYLCDRKSTLLAKVPYLCVEIFWRGDKTKRGMAWMPVNKYKKGKRCNDKGTYFIISAVLERCFCNDPRFMDGGSAIPVCMI